MYDKLTAFHITVGDGGSVNITADGIEQFPVTDQQGATKVINGNVVQPAFISNPVLAAAMALINAGIQEHVVAHTRNTLPLGGGAPVLARPNA